jgi:hypothetical protein
MYFRLPGQGGEVRISPAEGSALPCVSGLELGHAAPAD